MSHNIVSRTLIPGAFWQVNKAISKKLGSRDAALLLGDLGSRREYFRERHMLDDDGGFFVLAESIETDLDIGKDLRLRLIKILCKAHFLKVEIKGMPKKTYFYIQDAEIADFLSYSEKQKTQQYQPIGEVAKTARSRMQKPPVNNNIYNKNKSIQRNEKTNSENTPGGPLGVSQKISIAQKLSREFQDVPQKLEMFERFAGILKTKPEKFTLKQESVLLREWDALSLRQKESLMDDDEMHRAEVEGWMTDIILDMAANGEDMSFTYSPSSIKKLYIKKHGKAAFDLAVKSRSIETYMLICNINKT